MIKRAWLLVSVVWAVLCLWGGVSTERGLEVKDLVTAFAPFALGIALFGAGRFVVTGRWTRPEIEVLPPPRRSRY